MKRLTINLPPKDYRALERLSREDERTPWQEAAWLLRQAIHGAGDDKASREREEAEALA